MYSNDGADAGVRGFVCVANLAAPRLPEVRRGLDADRARTEHDAGAVVRFRPSAAICRATLRLHAGGPAASSGRRGVGSAWAFANGVCGGDAGSSFVAAGTAADR